MKSNNNSNPQRESYSIRTNNRIQIYSDYNHWRRGKLYKANKTVLLSRRWLVIESNSKTPLQPARKKRLTSSRRTMRMKMMQKDPMTSLSKGSMKGVKDNVYSN
jgi:hypothetical protein